VADTSLQTEIELSPGARFNTPTMLLHGYGILALGAVSLAISAQRPELLAVGAPAMVLLMLGLIDGRYPAVAVTASRDAPRALEGEATTVAITLTSPDSVGIVEVEVAQIRSFETVGPLRQVVSLRARRPKTIEFALIPLEWGVLELPSFMVRARKATGLFASTTSYRCTDSLRVHIHEEPARSLLEPSSFRRVVGSHLTEERADGCEIADVRPYQPGDQLRSVNWRISARRDEPWVTVRHPDRSTTIALVLDAFGNYTSDDQDTLRRSVRAAMGLARMHLNAQDQVGLLLTGHGRRWIPPQLGASHLITLTDALLELSTHDWADRQHRRQRLDRLIPLDAVVIAVSPLLNDAFSQLLQPLLARGQQVDVIEPIYGLPANIEVSSRDDNGDPTLAWRVFEIEQHLRRRSLMAMGASVSPWSSDEPIESTLLRLQRARRAKLATVRAASRNL
jgi:uncharacterized protein (DUF58 family)